MKNQIKKIGVMTSGGDSPGMNAAIRSVVRACAFHDIECYGIYRGYEGMIEGGFVKMDARSVKGIINKGGTILKSARSKEFRKKEYRKSYKDLGEKAAIKKLLKLSTSKEEQALILEQSMENGWIGIFALKSEKKRKINDLMIEYNKGLEILNK